MYVNLHRRHDRGDLRSCSLVIVYLASSSVDQPVEPVFRNAVDQTTVRETRVMRMSNVSRHKRPLHERNGVNSSQADWK